MESKETLKIKITDIYIDPNAGLRKVVDKDREEYQNLRDSIRDKGVINSISVRPNNDPDIEQPYILVDGLHRLTALKDVYLQARAENPDTEVFDIPAQVFEVKNESQVYLMQMAANTQSLQTKPVELRDAILSFMAAGLEDGVVYTQADVAKAMNKSQPWVAKILSLQKLDDGLAGKVNSGEISAANAYLLAKLPADEQLHFADAATTQSTEDFAERVEAFISEYKKTARKNRPDPNEFRPKARALKTADLEERYNNWMETHFNNIPESVVNEQSEILTQAKEENDFPALFTMGVAYGFQMALQITEEELEEQRLEHEAQVAERLRKQAEKEKAVVADKAADAGVKSSIAPKRVKPVGF